MTPERPPGADAIPIARSRPLSRAPGDPSGPRRGQAPLYAALDLGTNSCRMLIAQPKGSQFTSSTAFPRRCSLARGWRRRAGCRGLDGAHGAGAAHLPEEDRKHGVTPDAAGRDRGLPPRPQRPRLHPPGAARDRPAAGDHRRPRKRRGWPSSPARRWSDPDRTASGRRHRRRLDRTGLDRPVGGAPPRPARAIMRLHAGFQPQGEGRLRGWWTGSRCRSASRR
jgi:exopolyphosphatase / guanosine-5'-triphosphate,3'-diphosphate pyrophosphatase